MKLRLNIASGATILCVGIVLTACTKNRQTSSDLATNGPNSDRWKTHYRKVKSTMQALFPYAQKGSLQKFQEKFSDAEAASFARLDRPLNYSYTLLQSRLVDRRGLVYAEIVPSLSPYHTFPWVHDFYVQREPKVEGSIDQDIRYLPSYWTTSPEIKSDLFYKNLSVNMSRDFPHLLENDKNLDADKLREILPPMKWVQVTAQTKRGEVPPLTWVPSNEYYKAVPTKAGLPQVEGLHVEKRWINLHSHFKGGEMVTFRTILECNKSPLEVNVNFQRKDQSYRVAHTALNVREIRDGVIKTTDGDVYKTKEAYGYIDSTIHGRDPDCVIGRTVFDAEGRLYGVVTSYTPGQIEGGQEIKEIDNLVIATVQDERVSHLLGALFKGSKLYFTDNANEPPFLQELGYDIPKGPWQATKMSDRFDPEFIQSLQDPSVLATLAVYRTGLNRCETRDDLESACKKEQDALIKIRDSNLSARRPTPPARRVGTPPTCSMVKHITASYRLQCQRQTLSRLPCGL